MAGRLVEADGAASLRIPLDQHLLRGAVQIKNLPYDKARAARYPWRAWYGTPEWKALRAAQLRRESHCRLCAEAGLKTPADTVDHTVRHRGRRDLFFDPRNLASLCKRCHDSTKQQTEALGYSTKIGADGLPVDKNHPFNRG